MKAILFTIISILSISLISLASTDAVTSSRSGEAKVSENEFMRQIASANAATAGACRTSIYCPSINHTIWVYCNPATSCHNTGYAVYCTGPDGIWQYENCSGESSGNP